MGEIHGGTFATPEELVELEKYFSPAMKASMQTYHDTFARIRKGPPRPPATDMAVCETSG